MTTRTRTRAQPVIVTVGSKTRYDKNGIILSSDAGKAYALGSTETMVDEVTPGYFELKKTGAILPVNPMTHTRVKISEASTQDKTWTTAYVYMGTPYYTEIFGNVNSLWNQAGVSSFIGVTPLSSFTEADVPEAPSLAYMLQEARAKAHTNAVDLSTMFAELDKSVDLVSDVYKRAYQRAQRVIDAATKIRKGDMNASYRRWSRAAKIADLMTIASQLWLEYRFGWRLLVKDIESLHEWYSHIGHTFDVAYERGTFKLELEGPKKTIIHRDNVTSFATGHATGTLWGKYTFEEYLKVRRSIRVGSMVRYTADRPVFGDPFVTAWELVPLSWVADMFVNIGSGLRAWSPFIAGAPVHQWMSDDVHYLKGRTCEPDGGYGSWPHTYGFVGDSPDLTSEIGWKIKNRAPVDMQGPSFGFNPGIPKIAKMADLAAVVTQFGNRVFQLAAYNVKTDLSWFR